MPRKKKKMEIGEIEENVDQTSSVHFKYVSLWNEIPNQKEIVLFSSTDEMSLEAMIVKEKEIQNLKKINN